MRTIKQISNQFNTRIGVLKRERDKLRAMEDEIAEYRERAETAIESLEYAVEVLSEIL